MRGRAMTMPSPSRGVAGQRGGWAAGPPAAFAAAVLIAFIPLAMSWLTMPRDLAMLLTSMVLFVLAGVIALVGWRSGRPGRHRPAERDAVTYLDVAGALTFIGIFAASQVDPDQMVRMVAAAYRED